MIGEYIAKECCVLLHGFGRRRHRLLSSGIVDFSGGREKLRETLATFLVLTIERVRRRIVFVYDCAERSGFGTLVLEVDDFFGDLVAVQRISHLPHPGEARMTILWIKDDLGEVSCRGHGRSPRGSTDGRRRQIEWAKWKVFVV